MFEIPMVPMLLLFWFTCGFIATCGGFAYFQREYSLLRRSMFHSDRRVAFLGLLCGPFGLIVFFGMFRGFMHGFLNPWGKKAKQEAGLI